MHYVPYQTDRDAEPQAVKLHVQPKCQTQRDGQGDDVVGEEVGRPADGLLADAAEEAVGAGAEAVEDLGQGDDGEGVRDDGDDLLILGEEAREVEAEGAVHGEVEDTDDDTHDEGLRLEESEMERSHEKREGKQGRVRQHTTLAAVLAASTRPAPMRLAMRVDVAMETGKGIW